MEGDKSVCVCCQLQFLEKKKLLLAKISIGFLSLLYKKTAVGAFLDFCSTSNFSFLTLNKTTTCRSLIEKLI